MSAGYASMVQVAAALSWDDPAIQSQTSAALASITFAAPTGGVGSYSYAVIGFNTPVGSSAVRSGSGLGPHTFTTDVEGAYSVELEVTDSLGIKTRATGVVNLDLADSPLVWSNPDPTTQNAAALASHTFDAPTGGTGGYSYSASLVKKPTGSSATLSGSGLGAYSFTTDVPGVYEVRNTVTDSRGITQSSTWVVNLKPPQIAWTMPASQLKTSAGAEGITFNAASGGTGTLTYSDAAFAEKPGGSAATLSGSGVGPYSFTTDNAGNYIVKLKVTDEQGVTEWMFAVLTLDLTGAATWTTLVDIELTGADTQAGLGTNGSYTLVNATDTPAGQSVTLDVRNQDATNPPTVATLTNGTGLVVTLTPTSTAAQQKNFAFRVDNIPGVTFPDLDRNELCADVWIDAPSLGSNTDSIVTETAQANPPEGSPITYGVQLYRTTGTDYRLRTFRRITTTATVSSGTTVKASALSSWNGQWHGRGRSFISLGEEQIATLKDPNTLAYSGNPGTGSVSAADTAPSDWTTPIYIVVSFIAHTTAAVVSGTIKRIVIRYKPPAIS